MFRWRCPRCGNAPIYQASGKLHDRCLSCDLLFNREPGYFIGALYFSYAMASALLGAIFLLVWNLAPTWDPMWHAIFAAACLLPVAPTITRFSRVIWLYFDHWAWPLPTDEST